MDTPRLYNYQQDTVKRLANETQKHIVVATMGAGKSAIALNWAMDTPKRKWLVITTASARDSKQWYAEFEMWCKSLSSCVSLEVISWAGLAKWTMANWSSLDEYAFIFDECLPYDTLVETEFGLRQIGTLTAGDKVWSYNEQTSLRELKTITRTIKRRADQKMYKITAGEHELISTANHPHYTQRGWVEARDIKEGDTIYVATEEVRNRAQDKEIRRVCELSLLPATNTDSRMDFQADTGHGKQGKNILQPSLCKSKSEPKTFSDTQTPQPNGERDIKDESTSKRPEERQEIRGVRVESIEVLKLTDIKRGGLYCDPNNVYCIDVEDNHNFFANGILTHNCQKAKAGVSSNRGRAFIQITNRTECWAGFTGTPGDCWMDFYAYMVAGGYVKNKTEFKRRFVMEQHFKGYPEIVGYMNEDTLREYWEDMTVCPDTSAMLKELPAEQHHVLHFKPDPYYKTLLKTHKLKDGTFLETSGAFCAAARRLCFTKAKQQWLADYLEGLGEPTVLFYAFTETGDRICEIATKALPKGAHIWRVCGSTHDIPTAETIGKQDVVVCQWQAGSEALNLQFMREWVSVEPCYAYSTSQQARGRIKRIGQKQNMEFWYLKTDKTIEEDIYAALKNKGEFSERNWVIDNYKEL